MIQKPEKITNFDQLNKFVQDFYNNIGIEDLKTAGVLTSAPTADQLNPGQQRIVELSGVPYVYYKTIAGVLYKKIMDLA